MASGLQSFPVTSYQVNQSNAAQQSPQAYVVEAQKGQFTYHVMQHPQAQQATQDQQVPQTTQNLQALEAENNQTD